MSRDSQQAPDVWIVELGRLIDIDGVRVVLVRNQDGEEFLIDEDDYDPGAVELQDRYLDEPVDDDDDPERS